MGRLSIFFWLAYLGLFSTPLYGVFIPYDYLVNAGADFSVRYREGTGALTFKNNGISGELLQSFAFFTVNGHIYTLENAPITGRTGLALLGEDGRLFKEVITFYLTRLKAEGRDVKDTLKASGKTKQAVSNLNEAEQGSEVVADRVAGGKFKGTAVLGEELDQVFVKASHVNKLHTIILDPGHGGRDPGATGFGYKEKEIVLLFAKRLATLIKKHNPKVRVLLTRQTDKFLTIVERSRIANRALKRDENGLFVSLHLNAWFHGRARGYEVYYLSNDSEVFTVKSDHHIENNNFFFPYQQEDVRQAFAFLYTIQYARESQLLAEKLLSELKKRVPSYAAASEVKTDTFYVLKGTIMPSVLIELGYITNERDLAFLLDDVKSEQLLVVIETVLAEYMALFHKTRGFTRDVFQIENF